MTWRDYWAFGTGVIGDMSPHHIDAALWALDLAAPQSVEASCAAGMDAEIAPPASIIRYHFGPRGDLPPLDLTWYDGGLMPPRPTELEDDDEMGQSGNGTIFVGDKGKMMCAGWGAPKAITATGLTRAKAARPPAATSNTERG